MGDNTRPRLRGKQLAYSRFYHYKFKDHLEKIRDACIEGTVPYGTPARVADYSKRKLAKDEVQALVRNDKSRMYKWLEKRWPLGKWRVYDITVPGTWKDKELWVAYFGEAQDEEAYDRFRVAMAHDKLDFRVTHPKQTQG